MSGRHPLIVGEQGPDLTIGSRIAAIGRLQVHFNTGPMAQSVADLSSLLAAVECPDSLIELVDCVLTRNLSQGCVLGDDLFDLAGCKAIDLTAPRATQVEGFKFNPTDGYLVTFAALAAHRQKHVVFSHGWPILSVVPGRSTVTEAGGEAISARGGPSA